MQFTVASLDQMGSAVCHLLHHTQAARPMDEETCYYLRLVLSELITNGFQHGGGKRNAVRVDVSLEDNGVRITVDDGGMGIGPDQFGRAADVTSESGRGLAIVRGLCQSVELNDRGNCITARLALH